MEENSPRSCTQCTHIQRQPEMDGIKFDCNWSVIAHCLSAATWRKDVIGIKIAWKLE